MSDAGPSSDFNRQFGFTFTSCLRNGVKIPEVIFYRFFHGRSYNPVILTCEGRPDTIWGVDTEGRKLTTGWSKFAEENHFAVGDLLIFQYKGNQSFHVRRYSQAWNNPQVDNHNTQEDDAPLGNEERFVKIRVTADKVNRERMYLPKSFCEAHGLYDFVGTEISMVGEDETKFPVTLKAQRFDNSERLQLTYGLREFLESNDIAVNDEITLEMLRDDISAPTLKLRSKVAVVPN